MTLTLPVPQGLTPASLDAVVELPVNVSAATLTVSQDDRTIARMPLPDTDVAPISIPLAGAVVVDNAISLTLRTYLVPVEGYCIDPSNPLRVIDASVRYDGIEAPPTTVAEFLPPVLQRLTVYIPERPSSAVSDAAVRLTTSVAAHYGQQTPDIVVAGLQAGQTAPPGPSQPLERQIVINEGPVLGLSLQPGGDVSSLLISGPASEITNQVRLLSSDIGRLALSSEAVVGPLRSTPILPPDNTTLRELGQPGVNATALSPQVAVGLDQTRLGRSAHDVRVHLRGTYTPLPSTVGGHVVATVGGETIAHWPADDTGTIDRWVDVPDRLLQRYTTLGVALNISGNTGRCGEFQPITLTIDGDSPVQSSPAQPPVPGGFQSLPQALMPRVEVGIGDDAFGDTRRAVAILVGLQRLSAMPIDTAVMSVQQAVDSANPAVLVAAGEWSDNGIELPITDGSDGAITVRNLDGADQEGTLTLDPALRYGFLQTAYDGNRTVLVASSNGAPEQLDALLDWLGGAEERWGALTGEAVISVAGQEPVAVDTASGAQAAEPIEERSMLPLGIGAAIAAVVAVAGLVLVLLRRRGAAQDEP